MMTLAVIIPVYNCAHLVEEAIMSVLNQPCKDICVVAVNDGSKDDSLSVLNSLAAKDDRIIVIDQPNSGVSSARNVAIEKCIELGSKYIAFLDSDDVWCKGFYTDQLNQELKNGETDLLRFAHYDGAYSLRFGRIKYTSENPFSPYLSHLCASIYKTDIFKKHNVRFPKGIIVSEDRALFFVFAGYTKTAVRSNTPMFIYRSNPSSVMHKKQDARALFIEHTIPAWRWAREQAIQEHLSKEQYVRWIQSCDTLQKTHLAEFIQIACQDGMRIKDIQEAIANSGYSYLFDEHSIWIDDLRKGFWDSFSSHPRLTWLKHRPKGIYITIGRQIKSFPIIRRLKYPLDISNLH